MQWVRGYELKAELHALAAPLQQSSAVFSLSATTHLATFLQVASQMPDRRPSPVFPALLVPCVGGQPSRHAQCSPAVSHQGQGKRPCSSPTNISLQPRAWEG